MSAADNVALFHKWADTENDHQIFAHSGCEFHLVLRNRVLTDREYDEMMRAFFTGLPDYHCRLDDVFATDDRVASRWTITGTHDGELWGVPPTGRQVTIRGTSVVEFTDGRPVRFWLYTDAAGIEAQLRG